MEVRLPTTLPLRVALALTVVFAVLTLVLEPAAASAAPGPTPNGYIGACNMLQDPTMWTIPMVRDAPQGNAGMFHAVDVSGCS